MYLEAQAWMTESTLPAGLKWVECSWSIRGGGFGERGLRRGARLCGFNGYWALRGISGTPKNIDSAGGGRLKPLIPLVGRLGLPF